MLLMFVHLSHETKNRDADMQATQMINETRHIFFARRKCGWGAIDKIWINFRRSVLPQNALIRPFICERPTVFMVGQQRDATQIDAISLLHICSH